MDTLRRWITLCEEDASEFDYDDEESEPDQKPYRFLSQLDQNRVAKHKANANKPLKRTKERQRVKREEETENRHIPKSVVQYKAFKWPMIRFGKFRKLSKIGLDAEMRAELGNVTHEAGISCYRGSPIEKGYYLNRPVGGSNYHYGMFQDDMLTPFLDALQGQYERYRTAKTPMDIFIIHGHLVSFGHNQGWLDAGSDGEYLLDVSKPHDVQTVSPDKIWLTEKYSLTDYYESKRDWWLRRQGSDE